MNPLLTKYSSLWAVLMLFMVCLTQAQDYSSRATDAAAHNMPTKYRLQPMDLLRMEIFQEPDLNKEVRVEADGTIVLPLIGKVVVGNMSLSDAQDYIQFLYNKDYLVNPQVNLLIIKYAERRVQVLGQVNRPGNVVIPPEESLTITQAISGAGGFNRLANEREVQIRRTGSDGKPQVILINVKEVLQNPKAKDIYLQDKDTVYVDESVI